MLWSILSIESKESWPKGPGFGLPLKGAVSLKARQVESVYLWLSGQPVSQLAGIKLRANRHNGLTGTTFFNPGPDRSPTLDIQKAMSVMVHRSDLYMNDTHQGRL